VAALSQNFEDKLHIGSTLSAGSGALFPGEQEI